MAIVDRERTSAEIVMYVLYLYFLGLSFRNTSRALEPFVKRLLGGEYQLCSVVDNNLMEDVLYNHEGSFRDNIANGYMKCLRSYRET